MIGVVDYGAGNLRSVQAALGRLGVPVRFVAGPADLGEPLDALILPGVGRFGAAVHRLGASGLMTPLREFARSGRPFLGICLGMHLLFERSEEDPGAEGLGVIPGTVRPLGSARLPHIGWALVEPPVGAGGPHFERRPFFEGLPRRGFYAYFAHSYVVPPEASGAAAFTDCPPRFASVVERGGTCGVQFHPEKSGAGGERLLANFVAAARGGTR